MDASSQTQTSGNSQHSPLDVPTDNGFGTIQQKVLKQQLEKRNKARQQQLIAETDKLLKLATELKAEVDKSHQTTLSPTVIKKSEEIEKLARSVKDKMKNPL